MCVGNDSGLINQLIKQFAQGRVIIKLIHLAEWGVFMDGYEGSAAQEVDKKFDELCDCPDTALWESVKMK